MTQPVSPDRTSAALPDRGRATGHQPATRDAVAARPGDSGDTVRLAPGAGALKDILAARPSGGVTTPEDAARLASRVSRQLRDDPSGALRAFAATEGAAVRSFLATA